MQLYTIRNIWRSDPLSSLQGIISWNFKYCNKLRLYSYVVTSSEENKRSVLMISVCTNLWSESGYSTSSHIIPMYARIDSRAANSANGHDWIPDIERLLFQWYCEILRHCRAETHRFGRISAAFNYQQTNLSRDLIFFPLITISDVSIIDVLVERWNYISRLIQSHMCASELNLPGRIVRSNFWRPPASLALTARPRIFSLSLSPSANKQINTH